MINSRVLPLLLLVSSMASQVMGMIPQGISPKPPKRVSSLPFKVEGIAQKIEELPKELRYKIFLSALALRGNPKYEIYRKLDIGSYVNGIALNADNTKAFTGSDDGVARLWDVEKGTVLKELEGHTGPISSVALSADGTLALTGGSWDATARVWDTNTGKLIKTIRVDSHVLSVALSADGTLALTGGLDGIVRLYNTSTGELLKELEGRTGGIYSVALSADGTLALIGSDCGTARVWDMKTGKLLKTIPAGSPVYSVALSADGTIALTGTDNKSLVWDAKSGALLNTLVTRGCANSVALSKDGKRALLGIGNTIQVWNTKPLPGQKETRTPLTVLEGHTNVVMTVAFGSDDFIAASGVYDNTARIWKTFALEPRDPQEQKFLRQAYKETFSRPKFLFPDKK